MECCESDRLSDMSVEPRIGASLVALRERAGLSQRELAERAGTPLETVVGVESGAIEPPVALMTRLTAAIAASLKEESG